MKIRTDFPGANGIDFKWLAPGCLRFVADQRGGRYSMWFHFIVEEPECDVLCCEMARADTSLSWPYQSHVRPVFRQVGKVWERVPPATVDADAGLFRFEVACCKMTTEIAFCYPYQLREWERYYERCLAPAKARTVALGKSANGHPLFACEFGEGPVEIWLTSRCHSGETPGSYTLEGILTSLVASRDSSLTIRAIPFVDMDGVISGMYGKERSPVDFNRSWSGSVVPSEIQAYREYLASLPCGPVVAVDCHAPTANDPHYIEYSTCAGVPTEFRQRLSQLVQRIVRECESQSATVLCDEETRPHLEWYPDGFDRTQAGFLQARYNTLAFTLESAYHATHQGVMVGPVEWQRLGQSVAQAILGFLHKEKK